MFTSTFIGCRVPRPNGYTSTFIITNMEIAQEQDFLDLFNFISDVYRKAWHAVGVG